MVEVTIKILNLVMKNSKVYDVVINIIFYILHMHFSIEAVMDHEKGKTIKRVQYNYLLFIGFNMRSTCGVRCMICLLNSFITFAPILYQEAFSVAGK